MPKIPKSRLVINRDKSFTTEKIPLRTKRDVIFTNQRKKAGVLKFLSHHAKKRKKQTQKQKDRRRSQPFKHFKPRNGFYKFQRIETLVKNKHSKMKHWAKRKQRWQNRNVYKKKLKKQLSHIPILLIVRIHRRKNVPRQMLMVLHSLRLLRPFNCVIVRNSAALQAKLVSILPFVTFGVPSQQLICDLVRKRGQLIYKGQRSVIKSNLMVEELFGDAFELICVEDLVHVLGQNPYPRGHAFAPVPVTEMIAETTIDNGDDSKQSKQSNSNSNGAEDEAVLVLNDGRKVKKVSVFDGVTFAMNPFQLNTIKIPMRGLQGPFDHKGYWGYRGHYINTFVEKIL